MHGKEADTIFALSSQPRYRLCDSKNLFGWPNQDSEFLNR